jgi:sec-independent protein translocase protein TatA
MLYGIFIPGLGGAELIVLLGLGVLLFGRKLPELGRMFGRTITEVRNGLNGVEDAPLEAPRPEVAKVPDRVTATARPNFEDVPTKV